MKKKRKIGKMPMPNAQALAHANPKARFMRKTKHKTVRARLEKAAEKHFFKSTASR